MKFTLKEQKYKNPFCNWPRNLSCFCGRGKRFKNCHEKTIPKIVTKEQCGILIGDYNKLLSRVMNLKSVGHVFRTQKPIVE